MKKYTIESKKLQTIVTKQIVEVVEKIEIDTLEKHIGLKIKEIRLQNKMSQEEMAALLEISRLHYTHLEKGRFSLKVRLLEIICEKFNVKSSDILPF